VTYSDYLPVVVEVTDCRLSRGGGDGIRIGQLPNPVWNLPQTTEIQNTTVEHHSGVGVVITAPKPVVTACLLRGNGAHGLLALPVGDTANAVIRNNTAVENGGNGIQVESNPIVYPLALDHNLTTHNTGVGLVAPSGYGGVIGYNDSWANSGPNYTGYIVGPANLSVDPLYCMQSAGDFELRSDSPCAPSGVYGQIGALDVGCPVPAAVPPSVGNRARLHVVPNPARGQLSFAWDAGARLTELTIFDVTGRRVWSAIAGSPLEGGLHWDARDGSGRRLPAGVYLASWRFSDGAGGGTRMILLDD
jgi:hypothetical protein